MAVEFFAATEPKLAFAAVEMRGQGVLFQLVGGREDERALGLDAGKPGRPGRMPVQFVVAFGAKGLVASLALEFGLGHVTPHDGVGGKLGRTDGALEDSPRQTTHGKLRLHSAVCFWCFCFCFGFSSLRQIEIVSVFR